MNGCVLSTTAIAAGQDWVSAVKVDKWPTVTWKLLSLAGDPVATLLKSIAIVARFPTHGQGLPGNPEKAKPLVVEDVTPQYRWPDHHGTGNARAPAGHVPE